MNEDLDKFFGAPKPRRKTGCAVCGEPTAVQLSIQLREFGDSIRQSLKGGRSHARSWNVCAAHGLALFRRFEESVGLPPETGSSEGPQA